jgi:hypothetical protein
MKLAALVFHNVVRFLNLWQAGGLGAFEGIKLFVICL